MSMPPNRTLLEKVASKLGEPAALTSGAAGSILTVAASQYGAQPEDDEVTQPTGFDPHAAALFEAVIEGAFLVANADGEFDQVERDAFVKVVLSACGGTVAPAQVTALLADLADSLAEDGTDKRVAMVAKTITRPDQAREVLRVAGLMAHVSQGVSDVEREVLEKLAAAFSLDPSAVDETLDEVGEALHES